MELYELFWYLLIYSVLGWCVEVIYHTVEYGEFANRGFVNGPVCTIYGFGVSFVVFILQPIQDKLLLLFLGSTLLTTALEFVTGWILEKVFHDKWWDYSNDPFNIKGYVCLKFSILWGLACTGVLYIVQPIIRKLVLGIPKNYGIPILVAAAVIYLIDYTVTILEIRKICIRIRLMKEIADNMHKMADYIGENLYDTTVSVMEHKDEFAEAYEEKKTEFGEKMESGKREFSEKMESGKREFSEKMESGKREFSEKMESGKRELSEKMGNGKRELQENYRKLAEKSSFTMRRLQRAFPTLKAGSEKRKLEEAEKMK